MYNFIEECNNTILEKAAINEFSIFNDYTKINQNLTCPDFYDKYITWEFNRNIISIEV